MTPESERNIRLAIFVIVMAALACLIVQLFVFVKNANREVQTIGKEAETTIQGAETVLAKAADLETKLDAAADQQTEYWTKSEREMYKTVADVKQTIVYLDLALFGKDLHGGLTKKLGDSLDAATALEVTAARNLTDTTAHVNETIDLTRPALNNFVLASASAAQLMGDPNLPRMLQAGADTMVEVHGIAKHGDAIMARVEVQVDKATTPKSKLSAFLHNAGGFSLFIAEFIYYWARI